MHVLSYYKNTTLSLATRIKISPHALWPHLYHHFLRSMLKTTPPRPVNAGLNGKNVLKMFFLPWISTMRHANAHFFCTILARQHKFGIFETLTDTGDEKDYKKAMDRLTEHFTPQRDVDYETYLFRQARQQPNDTLDQFTTRLRQLASTCEFT